MKMLMVGRIFFFTIAKTANNISIAIVKSGLFIYSTYHMAYIDTMCFEWRDFIVPVVYFPPLFLSVSVYNAISVSCYRGVERKQLNTDKGRGVKEIGGQSVIVSLFI